MRSDVHRYYESIDHEVLLTQLSEKVTDRFLMNLLCQYVKRSIDCGGIFQDIRRGIAWGCAFSPLIAAVYLTPLDDSFTAMRRKACNRGLVYLRYMDDVLILARTRWQLRRANQLLNQHLHGSHLVKAPDKTFIGRIERGFDFLGYHFSRKTLARANITIRKMQEKYHRLYEQKKTTPEGAVDLDAYFTRWMRAGLNGMDLRGCRETSTLTIPVDQTGQQTESQRQ